MPATDNVQAFIKVLGTFYEAVDLEPPSQFKKFGNGMEYTLISAAFLCCKEYMYFEFVRQRYVGC